MSNSTVSLERGLITADTQENNIATAKQFSIGDRVRLVGPSFVAVTGATGTLVASEWTPLAEPIAGKPYDEDGDLFMRFDNKGDLHGSLQDGDGTAVVAAHKVEKI
jgi:hypothetical protein